jgi:hypothetical protein
VLRASFRVGLLCLGLLCASLLTGGCSPRPDAAPSASSETVAPTADTTDTGAVATDTTHRDTTRHDTMTVPTPPDPMAPGTARAVVRADACTERSPDAYTCTLRIESVAGYGPATPPLAAGRTVQAHLPSRLLTPETSPVFMEGNDTARVLMRHRGDRPVQMDPASGDAPDAPDWTVARIE